MEINLDLADNLKLSYFRAEVNSDNYRGEGVIALANSIPIT